MISDATYFAARRTSVRDRSAPIITPKQLAGEMGDPRDTPFDPRIQAFSILRQLPRLALCAAPVAVMWLIFLHAVRS